MTRQIITHLSSADPILGGVITAWGGFDMGPLVEQHPFEALGRAIAHQQLNGKAALSILNRFVAHCGAFPAPERLLELEDAALRAVGFSFSKIAALKDLAAKSIEGIVPERAVLMALDDEAIIERLTQVRGIGRWTVEMLLMFQLRRPDVMPVDDFGVRMGFKLAYGLRDMPAPGQLAAFATRWAPYRSAAAWFMWRALELAKEGRLPLPVERVRLPRLKKKARKKTNQRMAAATGGAQRTAKARAKRPASSAASATPRARAGARTRARPRPAGRSRAPAKKK